MVISKITDSDIINHYMESNRIDHMVNSLVSIITISNHLQNRSNNYSVHYC